MAAAPIVKQPAAKAMAVENPDRAKLVQDFQQCKKEAAANKQRGQAQWLGGEGYSPRPLPKAPNQSGKDMLIVPLR